MDISLARRIRSERLRGYFDLQLRFAYTVSQKNSLRFVEAVTLHTNFHRRFGLGPLTDSLLSDLSSSTVWARYIEPLNLLKTHEQRVDWTQAYFLQSPEESAPANERRFGCFSSSPPNAEGVIRIHFSNRDNDTSSGPLSKAKSDKRKQELKEMFVFIKSAYPFAKEVRGTSWLYHTQAYRRLFPLQFGKSGVTRKTALRFDGSSSWGQFLDHREQIKSALREVFLRNLTQLDLANLWRVFPLPALITNAPIEDFYKFYRVDS